MRIQSKYRFLAKIAVLALLSLPAAWLFMEKFYFSAALLLIAIIALALSLYQDRKKLIGRMERMIGSIRHADFSTRFVNNVPGDELGRLTREMDEALETFRERSNDSMREEAEVKAWQKLISVLTHEIMNSIAPIISLSETLSEDAGKEPVENSGKEAIENAGAQAIENAGKEAIENAGKEAIENVGTGPVENREIDPERYRIMQQAMETIHRRSKGLLTFVENYRKLTRLPQPVKQPILLDNLIETIQQLITPGGIRFTYSVYPSRLILNADKEMVEQLLINLLKNAHEACEGMTDKKVELKAEMVGDAVHLTVKDNGQGISPEAMDKVFIPFYSTKTGGSGIGLSLCRQIVARHKGKISVQSDKRGTVFKIEFPN